VAFRRPGGRLAGRTWPGSRSLVDLQSWCQNESFRAWTERKDVLVYNLLTRGTSGLYFLYFRVLEFKLYQASF